MTGAGTRNSPLLGPKAVVLAATVVATVAFLPGLRDGFVFDDGELIVDNPLAHDLTHVPRCFGTDLWDTPARAVSDAAPRLYRPLVCASYAVDYAIGGGSPALFHLTNLVAHAATCALAARVLLRWTGSATAALAAALVFAVHPTRSESVLWISGRTDIFAVAALLAALELAVFAARQSSRIAFLGALAAFGCALGSKEIGVLFPLLLGFEWLVARTEPASARADHPSTPGEARATGERLGRATAVFTVLAAAYMGARALYLPLRPVGDESIAYPPLVHAGYVLLTLGYYAARLVFPWPQTFHFQPVPFSAGLPVLSSAWVLTGLSAVGTWGLLLARAWKTDRIAAGLLVLFAVAMIPLSNLAPTHVPATTADRFLYLPLLPLAAYGGRALAPVFARWQASSSRLVPLVFGSGALVGTAVIGVRSLDYESDETMWRHELDVTPDNPLALGKLGEYLANHGDPETARGLLRRALSPPALRYQLLANPTRCYLGLLELAGGAIPDGDAPALVSLTTEIRTVLAGRVPDPSRRAPGLDLPPPAADDHFRTHVDNARAHLAAAGAFVASRLPADEVVEALLGEISADAPLGAAARFNLALALGRASAYGAARRELALAAAAGLPEPARLDLDATLGKVEALRRPSGSLGAPASLLARAEAFTLLGAHLRAARVLQRAFVEHPDDEAVKRAYFDALVAARLDSEAERVASGLPGMDPRQRVEATKQKLPPRLARLQATTPLAEWTAPALLPATRPFAPSP